MLPSIRHARRRGFTLLELLGVVFTLSVLMAVTLSGVMRMRERARVHECSSRLMQIGIALSCYHDAYNCLPSGSVDTVGPVASLPQGYQMSWLVQILPHVDAGATFNHIDFRFGASAPENLAVHRSQLSAATRLLHCPANPRPNRAWQSVGFSDFAGCHHDVEAPIDADNDGTLFLNSSVTWDQVTDGLGHTLLAGEKDSAPDTLGWMSGTRATLRNTDSLSLRATTLPATATAPNATAQKYLVGNFGSNHGEGVNFLFADGAVRMLRYEMDTQVYRALGNRHDGQIVADF